MRRSLTLVAKVLALVATIGFIPQCSPLLRCCKAESTAVLSHSCCNPPQVTPTTTLRVTLPVVQMFIAVTTGEVCIEPDMSTRDVPRITTLHLRI